MCSAQNIELWIKGLAKPLTLNPEPENAGGMGERQAKDLFRFGALGFN